MYKLLLLLLLWFPIFASGQNPYINVGVQPDIGLGYTRPNTTLGVGVDFNTKKTFTELSTYFAPAIQKDNLSGWQYQFGGTGQVYYRVGKRFGFGPGLDYTRLSTPVWQKATLLLLTCGFVESSTGSLFVNYFHSIALDQNRERGLEFYYEFGQRRLRPYVRLDVLAFTEPSYCTQNCVQHYGSDLEIGLRVYWR